MEGQSEENARDNVDFFCKNLEQYKGNIQNLDSYVNIRNFINQAVAGINNLLDIGNGGVFDYDVNLVEKITGLDLFFDQLPPTYECPSNVILKTGSALAVPEEPNSFDGVLMAFLIHHLIGNSVEESILNVKKSISEARRVLKPGGKFIVAESCVPTWFYHFEKMVFPLALKLVEKIFKHPCTLQYPVKFLQSLLEEEFKNVEVIEVPLGRWILIYGIKVPVILTPVKVRILVARK